jgi:TatA/E family protein of Tat protein translocase
LFGGGFLEIGFFLFIAYLLFGPKKVPEIARTLGKGLGELRRASNELRNSLEEEIRNLDRLPESGPESHDTTSTYGHHDPEPTHDEPESRP